MEQAMHPVHGGTPVMAVVTANAKAHLSATARGYRKAPARPKGQKKMNLIDTLKAAAARRAVYRQTRDEIARMPRDVALDLGIFPEDADRIAWTAVYGN
jgi:uncharacterized protein YjiS (DUF1127 family)